MNRPENKLVDGKTLRHVLILLKRIMELEGRLPDEGIIIEKVYSYEDEVLVTGNYLDGWILRGFNDEN